MGDLVHEVHELLGTPPAGKEVLVAVEADWIRSDPTHSFGAIAADLAHSVMRSLETPRYQSPGPDLSAAGSERRLALAHQELIEDAYEALGITRHMIWALNRDVLFVFTRTTIADHPKALTGRHRLADIASIDVGQDAGLRHGLDAKVLSITIHDLPVHVAIDGDEIVPFATTLQRLLHDRAERNRPPERALPPLPGVDGEPEPASTVTMAPPRLHDDPPVDDELAWDGRPMPGPEPPSPPTSYDDLA